MIENEERKNNNYLTVNKKRAKIKNSSNSQLSSEFRLIFKNEDNLSDKNEKIDEINDKKENIEEINNNNENINNNIQQYRRHTQRRKTKKGSTIKRKSLGFKQEEDIEVQDEDEDELNFRQRITKFFDTYNRLFYIQLITSSLSIITCLYYFLCTYIQILFISLNYIDFFVCTCFLIEHIINLLMSHHLISYIFSIESLINFIIEIPPFFSLLCSNFYLDVYYRFINVTRVFRLIKGYRIIELLQKGEKSVTFQIFNIIAILVEMVFIWAGIIQMFDLGIVENDLKITFEVLNRRLLLLRTQFHHYVYFIVVSLTTVGYGEFIPLSILGRFMIIFLVIVILMVVPEQTSELINLSNSQSIYERNKYLSSPDISFVILLGDIDLESLASFRKEYFDKAQGNPFKHIVILMNKAPTKSMELFLNKEENVKNITYLQGDPMNDNDLLRCDLLNAKSCIIFTNKNCIDPYSSDHQSLLLSVFIKKFYYHLSLENNSEHNNVLTEYSYSSVKKVNNLKKEHFRIFLQLHKPENCNHYFSTLQSAYKKNMLNDKLLVIESFKMNLLSKSCMTPGIISLISNLVIANTFEVDYFQNQNEWMREYAEGKQYQIFKIFIEGNLLNYTFQKLAIDIYNKYHCLLIALEISYKGSSVFKLNPVSNLTLNELIDYSFDLNNKENMNIDILDIDDPSMSFLEDGKHKDEKEYFNNCNKKNEIDKSKIKIFLFFICSDKATKNEIIKLDRSVSQKNRKIKGRELTSNNALETMPLNIFNKRKKTKKTTKSMKTDYDNPISCYSSDNDSEEEDITKIKHLVNMGNEGGVFLDFDELSKNYYISKDNERDNLYSNEIMKIGIKDRNDIKNHIIVCGMHHEIIHLILPLRSRYIPEKLLKWIVILANYLPQDIHDILNKFQKITFIQGDPLNPDCLYKANISSADIAVILSSGDSESNNGINNEVIGKDKDELNGNSSNSEIKKKNTNFERDAKTLFIYKSIKKINSSIQIITELLKANNIEFLHNSKELKKLFRYSKMAQFYLKDKNSDINKENNEFDNQNYELTPIYAAGEVFFPSLIDKITGQMFHKEYLYNILNLLLTGEKGPQKNSNKKLVQQFNNLTNSNLFLIPCESRNENFADFFQRLLTKNKMIAIALYRKNTNDNSYYVYINPRKTTLIRDTDLIFVLSSTDSILNLIEKNILNLESIKESTYKRLSAELLENKNNKNENESKAFLKELQDNIQQQIDKIDKINPKKEKKKKYSIFNELQNFEKKNKNKDEKEGNIRKGKYIEIDNLQDLLDKGMKKLKDINNKSKDLEKYINSIVKGEINYEFGVYLNKKNIHNT